MRLAPMTRPLGLRNLASSGTSVRCSRGAGHFRKSGGVRSCTTPGAKNEMYLHSGVNYLHRSETLPKFEECLDRLEKIVNEMEKGDILERQ